MKIKLSKIAVLLLAAAVLATPSCTDYKADITEVKNDVTKVAADLNALSADVDDLSDDLSALQSETAQLKTDLAAAKKAAEEAHQATNAKIENLQKAIDANSALIADCQKAIAAAQADIVTVKAQLEQQGADIETLKQLVAANATEIANCKARIEALEANVTSLWARLQSMVLVPSYTDGSINLNVLFVKKNVIEKKDTILKAEPVNSTSTIDYQFTPANQAAAVKALFDNGKLGASFDVTTVAAKTRAEAVTLDLPVKAVTLKDAAKGILTFTVDPDLVGFDPEKTQFVPEFAAALNLFAPGEFGADNRTSEYANVDFLFTTIKLGPVAEIKDGKVLSTIPALSFPYTDTDIHQYWQNCEAVFQVLGTQSAYVPKDFITVAQVKELFSAELPVYYKFAGHKLFDVAKGDEAKILFNTADSSVVTSIPYLTVQLDPAKTNKERSTLVGASAGSKIYYALDSLNYSVAVTKADITRADYVINGSVKDIKWYYDFDLVPDQIRAAADPKTWVPSYLRPSTPVTFEKSVAEVQKDLENLGVDDLDIPSSNRGKLFIGDKEQKYGISWLYFDKKDGYTIELNSFNFDKTIAYTAKNTVVTPKVNLKFTTAFNTIDRSREPIVISFPDSIRNYVAGDSRYTKTVFEKEVWAAAKAAGFQEAGFQDASEFLTAACFGGLLKGKTIEVKRNEKTSTKGSDWTKAGKDFWAYYPDNKPGTFKSILTLDADWGQTVQFEQVVGFTAENYDLKANSYYVDYDSEKNVFYTTVNPEYKDADGHILPWHDGGLAQYANKAVDVPEIFYFVKDTVKLSDAAAAQLGLTESYNFRKGYAPKVNDGGILKWVDGKLQYEAAAPSVRVAGTLKIGELFLPSSFDSTKVYETYEVRRFEPIASFTAQNDTINIVEKGVYTVALNELLSMVDKRGDKGQLEGYEMIKGGKWIIGNKSNGFGIGIPADYAYKFYTTPAKFTYTVNIPEELEDIVTVGYNAQTEDYELVYNHKYESQLTKPIVVTFSATADSRYHGKASEKLGLKSTVGTVIFE